MFVCVQRPVDTAFNQLVALVYRENKKRETCGDRPGKFDLGAQQSVTNRPR